MKKVFKVNLGVVMAVFAAFGLMSFKMATRTVVQTGWYALGEPTSSGTPINEHIGATPGEDCLVIFQNDLCAVKWDDPNNEPPEYLEQMNSPETAGRTP